MNILKRKPLDKSKVENKINSAKQYRTASRLLSLTLIFALLVPFLALGNFSSVYAQGILPANSQLAAYSPSGTYKASDLKFDIASPGLFISNSAASISSYVTTPTLPKGFEKAQRVSPFSRDLSTAFSRFGSSLASFLGLFVNTTAEAEATSDGAFPNGSVPFDFDNDGKADVSRWNPSSGEWKVMDNQGNLTSETLGTSSSIIVPGDYDADGKTDKAVWDAGTWTVRKSTGGADATHSFGQAGDIPVSGDYDGDGISDYAVFRPSNNVWYIQHSGSSNALYTYSFGTSGDITAQGDYDGDHKTDIAVFRPSTGYWHVLGSTSGYYGLPWGLNGDIPVPADFNNDNRTDYGIYRPSTGTWYVYHSDGSQYLAEVWGNYGDQPVAADYDGDGKADLAVWRPKTGVWLIKQSSNGTYRYETLGINSDVPVPAAYLPKVGFQVSNYEIAQLRLSPENETGGTNLYSRNFGWETGLVGLPGRAGLNAGFGVSYNSLVWIKDDANNSIHFDPDFCNVSPGFNLGFARIEPAYYDSQTGKFSFLMVTPSGKRVEFKQTAASDTYETVDSSFTQLKLKSSNGANDPPEDIGITMTTTDGTKTEFEYKAGVYLVKQIKDRNGNYIDVVHNDSGLLETVTDTLGRVITVNYDAELYPTTITQQWKNNNGSGSAITHTYATFSYVEDSNNAVNTNFSSSLTVYGPPNGTVLKVLDRITFANGSSTRFDYNGYGQVERVRNFAANGTTELNYVETNLDSVSGTQTDVPRIGERRTWVKDFNNDTKVTVTNTLGTTAQTLTIPGESNETGKLIQIKMLNNPYDAATNIYVGDSGWKEGLPILTEDYVDVFGSSFLRKRWSFNKWEQDDPNLSYSENPRVKRTKVGDDENLSVIRTEIDYVSSGSLSEFNLPLEVRLYDDSNNALQKRTHTTYEDESAYLTRRIIGLPKKVENYGYDQGTSQEEQVAEIDYAYDEEDFTIEPNQIITATQHDVTNFGSTLITGRGNLTSVTRNEIGTANSTVARLRYDIAGSTVASISPDPNDPNGRKITTSYTDSFTDGTVGTYAYPTTLTDPNGKSSTVKYRFDIGANVKATSPAPIGNSVGKVSKRIFNDMTGRVVRDSIYKDGTEHFYRRYEYPNNHMEFASYSTLVAGQGEVESRSFTDGAGRVLKSRTPHRSTISGTWRWAGTKIEYDILGRAVKASVPKEVDANFVPKGDDANTSWLWNHTEYDWRNRPIRRIKTDGAVDSNGDPLPADNQSDTKISYSGCGCAGGQITTITGEEIVEKDWDGSNPNSLGRRTQKVYQDILGRNWKSEILNWDNSVYSTTVAEYDRRNKVLSVTQYEGIADSSNTNQVTISTYDGYGRLKTRKTPQQDSASSYNYNIDNSIQSMSDARGMITAYTYNSRGLVTNVSYDNSADTEVYDPRDVDYEYDDLGNRTKMTDDTGETTYAYNELSQMISETRNFDDSLANAPSGGYTITYEYTLSGQLKSIEDPFQDKINYTHDKLGRLTSVDGAAAFDGVTNYADNPHYRAWGSFQSLDYGNGLKVEMTFNERLRAETFKLTDPTNSETHMDKEYDYYADGRLRKLNDKILYDDGFGNDYDKFDRLTTYDHLGRPKIGLSGRNAREGAGTVPEEDKEKELPYEQSYQFNTFNNMTQRLNEHWGIELWNYDNFNLNYTYQNNRISNPGWEFDADGRVTHSADPDDTQDVEYDAVGRLSRLFKSEVSDLNRYYDGNGSESKRNQKEYSRDENGNDVWTDKYTYYVRSSILDNQILTNLDDSGRKTRTYIYAAGTNLAWQDKGYYASQETEAVKFNYTDASGMSLRSANKDGDVSGYTTGLDSAVELDPLGGNVGLSTPYITLQNGPIEPETPMLQNPTPWHQYSMNPSAVTYNLDGAEVPSWVAEAALRNGSAVQCPNNYCGPRLFDGPTGPVLSLPFQAYADGTSGFQVPVYTQESITIEGETHWFDPEFVRWEFVEQLGTNTSNYLIQDWRNLTTLEQQIVEGAVESARVRVSKQKCFDTIREGNNNISPEHVLDEVFARGNIKANDSMKAAAQAPTGQLETGRIELGKSFFKKKIKDGYGIDWVKLTGLSRFKVREFILLHETRHLFGATHNMDGGLENDIREILKNCFGVTTLNRRELNKLRNL